jgi:hypothetical protein
MRAAIAALGSAQTLITDRTDKAIERGLDSFELLAQVKASASAVRAAMLDFQKVDTGLVDRDGIPMRGLATPAAMPGGGPPAAVQGSVPPAVVQGVAAVPGGASPPSEGTEPPARPA